MQLHSAPPKKGNGFKVAKPWILTRSQQVRSLEIAKSPFPHCPIKLIVAVVSSWAFIFLDWGFPIPKGSFDLDFWKEIFIC